jgi:hypothetical protein
VTAPQPPDELLLANGVVEVRIPRTHGPRVTHYGFAGGPNLFGDGAGAARETPHGLWRAFGGHRLWAAPEVFPDTYTIDDEPPQISHGERRAVATQRRDPLTGLRKTIAVELEATGTGVTVTHTIANEGSAARTLAPWALTVAATGGAALIPNPVFAPQPEALLPARTLALWRYTDLADARFAFGPAFVRLRCDPNAPEPNKIGVANERGWFAYLLGRTAFVIRTSYDADGDYPDRGCSIEVYTQGGFCEVETLAPLSALAPGASVTHVERWSLAEVSSDDDASLARDLGNHLAQ